MGTHWKYHSKYVDGGRPPYFLLNILGVDIKKWEGVNGEKIYFFHAYISFELI